MSKSITVESDKLLNGVMSIKADAKIPSASDRRIWALSESGVAASLIATKHNLTIATVKRCLRKVEKFLFSNAVVEVAELRMQHHCKLGVYEREAMRAWKKSSGKVVRKTTKYGPHPDDPEKRVIVECSEVEEYKAGDPRFLLAASKFLSEQRQIWPGANAPKAQAITNADGTGDARLRIDIKQLIMEMTPEERELVNQVASAARAKMIQAAT